MNKLPFTVLDSFLGTGKTTFLNHVQTKLECDQECK